MYRKITYYILKKEIMFIIIFLISFCVYIYDNNFFWTINSVPNNSPKNFQDFRYLQYIADFYPYINANSNELYAVRIFGGPSGFQDAVLNYPRIWIFVSKHINIKNEDILYLSYFVIVFLYIKIFYNLIKKFDNFFFLYLFYSGSSLFLLQRGNVDIIIFLILYYSFTQKNTFIKYTAYLTSSFLKIYPAFSLLFFLNYKKNFRVIFILSLIFIFYLFLIKNDLKNISTYNPVSGNSSYGLLSIILNINEHFSININYIKFLFLNFICLFVIYFFTKEKLPKQYKDEELFLLGSGIFIFTFIINTHHDYRLIFLFLCAPLLLSINNKIFKFFNLFIFILTLELHRLLSTFGFFGGVVNSFAKLIFFYIMSILYIDIIKKNYFR